MQCVTVPVAVPVAAVPVPEVLYRFDELTLKARLVDKGIDEGLAGAVAHELCREKFVTMETLSSLADSELEEFGLKTRGERRMFRLAFGMWAPYVTGFCIRLFVRAAKS